MVHDVATCCYYHPNGEDPLWGWEYLYDGVMIKVWNDPQYDPENSACGYPIYPFEVDFLEFELFVPDSCTVIATFDIEDFIWDHCSPYPSWPPIYQTDYITFVIPEGGFWYLGAELDPPVCVYDRFFVSFGFYNTMDFDPTCYESEPPYECEIAEPDSGIYNPEVPYHFAGSAIFDQGGFDERTYWSYGGAWEMGYWWDGLIWWPGAVRLWAYGYVADQNQCDIIQYWWQKEAFFDTSETGEVLAYAPCGIPDFDQNFLFPGEAFDGPTALANCLWWMAAGGIIDPFWGDNNGDGSVWDPDEPPYLENLIATYINWTPAGVDPYMMNEGLQGIHDDYIMWFTHTHLQPPSWEEIEYNLRLSQDVILLLGFWYEYPEGSGEWWRIGGHWVTAAGVDHITGQLKISDPDIDAAEMYGTGFICSNGIYIVHDPIPHVGEPWIHNDAGNASHDVYTVAPSPSPGGVLALFDYPYYELGYPYGPQGLEKYFAKNVKPEFLPFQAPTPDPLGEVFVEIEAAKVLCPEIPMTSSRIQMTFNNHGSYYDFSWDMDEDGFFDYLCGYQGCLILGTYDGGDNLATDYGSTDEGAWYTNVADWVTDAIYFTGPGGDHRFVRNYCVMAHNTLPLQIEWWIVGDFDPTHGACEDAVFIKYVITNTGDTPIEDIQKALYQDFDVPNDAYDNTAINGEETFSSIWQYNLDFPNLLIGMTQKPVYEDKPNSFGGFGVSQAEWVYPAEGWVHAQLDSILRLGTWEMDPTATQPEDCGMMLIDNSFNLLPGESYCNEYIFWAYDATAPIDGLTFGQFLYALFQQDGYFRGDVADKGDGYTDGVCNITDITYMISYVLKSGPAPVPFDDQGDVNCDGNADITDIVYLIDYVLKSGPYPIDKNRFFFDQQPYELMFSRTSLFADPVWSNLYMFTFR
jgi:hypothetical protein